jgi:hypothetical protein
MQLANPVKAMICQLSPNAPTRSMRPLGACTVTVHPGAPCVVMLSVHSAGVNTPPSVLLTWKVKSWGEGQSVVVVVEVVVVVVVLVEVVVEVVVEVDVETLRTRDRVRRRRRRPALRAAGHGELVPDRRKAGPRSALTPLGALRARRRLRRRARGAGNALIVLPRG